MEPIVVTTTHTNNGEVQTTTSKAITPEKAENEKATKPEVQINEARTYDDGPRPLYVGLTGFGPFMNIDKNPSEELQKLIAAGFTKRFEVISASNFKKNSRITLMKHMTVIVEPKAADEAIEHLHSKVKSIRIPGLQQKFLMIHLGVHSGLTDFEIQLESRCYNSRNFTPENEYTPNKLTHIDQSKPHDDTVTTLLPIVELSKKLKEKHPFVKLSTDPGRYLCNYI